MTATFLAVPVTLGKSGSATEVVCADCSERYLLATDPAVIQTLVAALSTSHRCDFGGAM